MLRKIGLAVCGLVLAIPLVVGAEETTSGKVVRVDPDARVIVLDDDRMYRLESADAVVLVDERPVELAVVQPGTRVVIRSGERVELRDGRYVVIGAAPAALPRATVVTPAALAIVTPPALVTGTVRTFDPLTGAVVLDGGQTFVVGPGTVVMSDGQVWPTTALRPGLHVTLSAVNPVVYRDGRYALMNEGFRDMNSSVLGPDARYHGLAADMDSAAMQVQAGGGGAGS